MAKAEARKSPTVSRKAGSFTIAQPVLAEMLGVAVKSCGSKSTVAAVACVRIKFGGEGVCVEATNYETWVRMATKNFEPEGATAILVPCQAFYSVISNVPQDQEIELFVTDKKIQVKTESAKYHFGLLDVTEWPEILWNEKSSSITIDAEDFSDMIRFVGPSVSVTEARYYLCGINIRITKEGKLRVIGCDGHRLSVMLSDYSGQTKIKDNGIILSREFASLSLDMFERLLPKDAAIELTLTESKARIEISTDDYEASIIGKLIDGTFPDIDRVIPYGRTDNYFTVNRENLIVAIKRLAIMADLTKDLPIKFDISKGTVVMKSNGGIGDAEEVIYADMKDGTTGKTCMGVGKMLSIFQAFTSKDLTIFIGPHDEKDPTATIMSETNESITDQTRKFSIIMPMRG